MMKKSLLVAALSMLAISSAYAEFPTLEFSLPATYLPKLTSATQLTQVTLRKSSWSDKQDLQLVENSEKAYILNLESDEVFYATKAEVTGTGVGVNVVYTFPAMTVNGEYDVVIPAGTLETVEGKETNPEFSHTYTLADPSLEVDIITPVTLSPAAGTAIKGVNSQTGQWTVAFDPEIQKEAGYMKVIITDADADHLYEGEPFYSQIQINRREDLALGKPLDMDLTEPFKFTWGGKEGSGLMYQGYEYKCRFEVRKSEYNEGRDGNGEILGIYECIYSGNTMPEQYADIQLVNVSPTPKDFDAQNPDGYIFETTSDPHVTFFFNKPVEPNTALCAVNTGSGSSVPFEGTAESSNEGKEWRFTIPKSQIEVPSLLAYFAFTDPATGLPVKGNNGRGTKTTFSYEWIVEAGLPTLSAVSPEPKEELEEISRITLKNSSDLFFLNDGGTSQKATLSTKQGEVVYTFDYSKIEFDNTAKTVTLVADPAFTTSGAYVLTIPKGYFVLAASEEVEQFGTTYQNKAFNCEYYIKEAEEPVTLDAVFKSSTPENGTTVSSLKNVEIFFDVNGYAAQNYDFQGEAPVLKNAAGTQVATIDVEFGTADNSMKVTFNPEVTEPGEYTITFPDRFFKQDESNNYTPEFTLSWTVEEGQGTEMAYDLEITATPADNSGVESFSSFSFNFNTEVVLTSGSSMYKAVMMKEGVEKANTFMAPNWTNEAFEGAFSPAITETGVYTMTIAKDTFRSKDGLHANPETTFTWSVGSVGITVIRYVDGIAGDVYTLDGTLVVKQATAEDIEGLAAGIYLIGGNKYVVK